MPALVGALLLNKEGTVAEKFPIDEFDRVSVPGGRHRQPRTTAVRLKSFLGYTVLSVAIGGLGIGVLSATSLTAEISGSTGVAQANNHDLDRYNASGLGVTVLDASNRPDLATGVANKLAAKGWNVLTAANLVVPADPNAPAVPVGQPTPVPTLDKTVVYVSQQQLASTAKQVLDSVGNYEVKVAATYPDPITLVLGNDFKPTNG